ncbi:MAG: NAD-dependent epimerase/dehydratase family protein [Gaiellaceae bacterium]
MRRLLLTGAGGFIGRHLPALLSAQGFEVHAVGRQQVDLLDADATAALVAEVGASHLLHLAWYTEHGRFWEAPENRDWAETTLRLARSFRAAGGERLIAAGTCAEYEPSTLYGATKDATRRELEAYAGEAGLSFAWGRVFFPYGPGESPQRVVAAVARAAIAGEPVACSSGRQIRDFLYVEDVAAAFAALVGSEATGSFDIGSGEGVPLRDVLLTLEQLAGRQDIVQLGALPDRDEPASLVADIRRLRDEVGWRPFVELREGLERTLEWWREAILAPHS